MNGRTGLHPHAGRRAPAAAPGARRSPVRHALLRRAVDGEDRQEYFVATLQQGTEEIARRTEPDADLPIHEALSRSVDAFLGWIEENDTAYRKMMESVGSVPEVKALVDEIRAATSGRILEGIGAPKPAPPQLRAAAAAWLWYMDGAILDWLDHRDMTGRSCVTCCPAPWPGR